MGSCVRGRVRNNIKPLMWPIITAYAFGIIGYLTVMEALGYGCLVARIIIVENLSLGVRGL